MNTIFFYISMIFLVVALTVLGCFSIWAEANHETEQARAKAYCQGFSAQMKYEGPSSCVLIHGGEK